MKKEGGANEEGCCVDEQDGSGAGGGDHESADSSGADRGCADTCPKFAVGLLKIPSLDEIGDEAGCCGVEERKGTPGDELQGEECDNLRSAGGEDDDGRDELGDPCDDVGDHCDRPSVQAITEDPTDR